MNVYFNIRGESVIQASLREREYNLLLLKTLVHVKFYVYAYMIWICSCNHIKNIILIIWSQQQITLI